MVYFYVLNDNEILHINDLRYAPNIWNGTLAEYLVEAYAGRDHQLIPQLVPIGDRLAKQLEWI